MRDAGYEQYEFICLLEIRTCSLCGGLDGKRFPVKDAQPEMNMNPMHPNCRCFVSPVVSERLMKAGTRGAQVDAGGGKKETVPASMTYQEWYEKYVSEPKRKKQEEDKTVAKSKIEGYNNTIQGLTPVDAEAVTETAKSGGRHKGVYLDAVGKRDKSLQRSIASRTGQVQEHAEKIQHPAEYDVGWNSKDQRQKEGLLSKWRKDLIRNAEQAEIEITVWKERFDDDKSGDTE